MFGDIMGKLREAQEKMESIKRELDDITVKASVENGKVEVEMTGNRRVKRVRIDDDFLLDVDREGLEELLQVAVNQALIKADAVNEREMKKAASGMMPGGIPGMF